MARRKVKKESSNSCNYYHASKNSHVKGKIKKCKYCKRHFCNSHVNPRPGGLRNFSYSTRLQSYLEQERKDQNTHPCFQYSGYLAEELKKKNDKEIEALNRFLSGGGKTYDYFGEPSVVSPSPEEEEETEEKTNNNDFAQDVKRFFRRKYYQAKHWLNEREHRKYRNWHRIVHSFLWLIGISIIVAILWSNLNKLNDVKLWIIPVGGTLLFVSLFFWIKYAWKFLKKVKKWFNGERNWVKYLIIIIILLLVWQAYQSRDTVLDKPIGWYEDLNFTEIFPLDVNLSSQNNPSTSNSKKGLFEGISDSVSDTFSNNDRDVGAIEQEIFVLVNEERQRNGARTLSTKSNLDSFARSWSDKMISQGFFEHSNLNFVFPSTAGENIGETPIHYNVVGCGSTYSNDDMAKCFVDGWITSPGHHVNMISKSFSITGIGVSCDSSKCRATQVFAG